MDYSLTKDRAILTIIKKVGAIVCTGNCEHRKAGEWHCHNVRREVKISSASVKRRLREMVVTGLLNRNWIEHEDGKVMGQYPLAEKAMVLLKEAGSRSFPRQRVEAKRHKICDVRVLSASCRT